MDTESRAPIIRDATQALRGLYARHADKGILAIYLWGSVTRRDFDPKTSDIDVVCIVSDDFPKEHNEKLRAELTLAHPGREWGFQIMYLDELNGGVVRSRLAQAMFPQSILPSFHSWVWVCGKQYKRQDFSVTDATIPERVQLNIAEIRTRLARIPSDDDDRKIRDRKGAVKACLQLIYNRQLLRHGYFDLDYTALPGKADAVETPALRELLKIKQMGLYDEDSYRPYVRLISDFADMVEKELAHAES
jgi:predicted nucleotidyltransferase